MFGVNHPQPTVSDPSSALEISSQNGPYSHKISQYCTTPLSYRFRGLRSAWAVIPGTSHGEISLAWESAGGVAEAETEAEPDAEAEAELAFRGTELSGSWSLPADGLRAEIVITFM